MKYIIIILLLASCEKRHIADVQIVFNNGDKDTMHIEWTGELGLYHGRLETEAIGDPSFACDVRRFKIIKKYQ